MVIDFHTHVFPEKIAKSTIEALTIKANGHPTTDGTIQGLIDEMDRGGCDVAVTLPVLTKPTQFESVLRFATEINQRFSKENNKLISFAGIHPKCDDIDGKMAMVKEAGIKGVKIHPDYQQTFIDDRGYVEILKCAKKYDLIVVTHAGVDDGYLDSPIMCPPDRAIKVINEVDHGKFVLGHYGAHKQWQEVLDKIAGKNVYLDTAFTLHEIDEDLFKKILSKHGEDKILFATDCPWRDIFEDIRTIKSYNLGVETEEKIFSKNARKLLGI
ncbi:MAG: amidohydrolase family protein [Clostridia bacterium]|nr:amidohydrolase family protein [Clostridia bacterium]